MDYLPMVGVLATGDCGQILTDHIKQFVTTLSFVLLIYRGFIFVDMTAIFVSLFARYLLFNFPLLSALVGVSSNFVFLSVVFILSYLRLLLTVYWAPVQVRGDTNHCRYTF